MGRRRLSRGAALAALLGAGASLAGACSPWSTPLGQWSGEIRADTARAPVELEFAWSDGLWRGRLTSPALLIRDMPLVISSRGATLAFTVIDPDLPLRFAGTIQGSSLRVRWTPPPRLGLEGPVEIVARRVFARAPTVRSFEVRFPGHGVQLAGTWMEPRARPSRMPAVVLLHGSSGDLRWFHADYAHRFARAGFGALIFDRRGIGRSDGDLDAATLEDLIQDAVAAVRYARARPGVDTSHVGVWGLSQGGSIAPRVAVASGAAFVVSVSPPGMSVTEVAAYQDSLRVVERRGSVVEATEVARLHRRLGQWLAGAVADSVMAAEVAVTEHAPWRGHGVGVPWRLTTGVERANWYWAGRVQDPLPAWRELRVPALVIHGGRDELVPAQRSAERIESALRDAGHSDVSMRWFPSGNHALKLAPLPGEPFALPRPVPGYLDTMVAWMEQHAGSRRAPNGLTRE